MHKTELIEILNKELSAFINWPIGRQVCVQSPIDGELFFYKNNLDASMRIPGDASRPGVFLSRATGSRVARLANYNGKVD